VKDFILSTVISNGKLPAKRGLYNWFKKNDYVEQYNKIIQSTSFLGENVTMANRLWHIVYSPDTVPKCSHCDNQVNFVSYTKGYRQSCSNKCAQLSASVIEKTKQTNLSRYGVEYVQSNKTIQKKSRTTVNCKYGVDNISQLESIKELKKSSCLNSIGVESPLHGYYKKQSVLKKYGVDNVQKVKSIKQKRIDTIRRRFYMSLFSSDRLNGLSTPQFSLTEYLDSGYYNEYKFECNSCGEVFHDCLEDGDIPKCPSCYRIRSNFELEVSSYIKTIYTGTIHENDRTMLDGLELDIYIPELNLAIECDGLYWHSEENGKFRDYHLNKTDECEKKGIRLIHIFEDEWLYKKDIVKLILTNQISPSSDTVYGRHCVVSEIPSRQCIDFLKCHHLQGSDNSSIKLGLLYDNELVSVMTFGRDRFSKSNSYEIYRYCVTKTVVGGANKLFTHFIRNYNPTRIVTYSDKRYFTGGVYLNIGMVKLADTDPGYWYFSRKKYYRQHRFSFRKSNLNSKLDTYNPMVSNSDNLKNNGYSKIWDCGNYKFEWISK